MTDRKGEDAKRPDYCERGYIRVTPSDGTVSTLKVLGETSDWRRCINLIDVSGPTDFEGETYSCEVCGEHYRLYYDDMR